MTQFFGVKLWLRKTLVSQVLTFTSQLHLDMHNTGLGRLTLIVHGVHPIQDPEVGPQV